MPYQEIWSLLAWHRILIEEPSQAALLLHLQISFKYFARCQGFDGIEAGYLIVF